MGVQTLTRTIDGELYEVTQFPATQALRHLTTLTRLLGEPLTEAAGVVGEIDDLGGFLDMDVSDAVGAVIPFLSKAVKALVAKLDEAEVETLVKSLLEHTHSTLEGKAVVVGRVFDTYFAGRLGHLFKVLGFVLEVNYRDFFPEGGVDVGGVLSKMGSGSRSKQPSPGPSGESG